MALPLPPPPPVTTPTRGFGGLDRTGWVVLFGLLAVFALGAWLAWSSTQTMARAHDAATETGCFGIDRNGDYLTIEMELEGPAGDRCAAAVGAAAFELGFAREDMALMFEQPAVDAPGWRVRAISMTGGYRIVFSPLG